MAEILEFEPSGAMALGRAVTSGIEGQAGAIVRDAVPPVAEQASDHGAAGDPPIEPVDWLVDDLLGRALSGDNGAARVMLTRFRPQFQLRCDLPVVQTAPDALAASTALISGVAAGRVPVMDALFFQKLLSSHVTMATRIEAAGRRKARDTEAKAAAAPEQAGDMVADAELKAAMNDPEVRVFTVQAPQVMGEAQQRDFLAGLGLELRPKDKLIQGGIARAPGLWDIYPPLALTPEPRTFTVALPPHQSLADIDEFLAGLGIEPGPEDEVVRGPVPTFEPLLVAASPPLRETFQHGAGRFEDGAEPDGGGHAGQRQVELGHLGGDGDGRGHGAQEPGQRELAGAGHQAPVQGLVHVGPGPAGRAVADLHIADEFRVDPREIVGALAGAHDMQQIDQQRDIASRGPAELAHEIGGLVERAEAAAGEFQAEGEAGGTAHLREAGELLAAAGAVGIERDGVQSCDAQFGIQVDDRLQPGGIAPRLDHQPFAQPGLHAQFVQHGAELAPERPVLEQRPGGIAQRIVVELPRHDGNVPAPGGGGHPGERDRAGADLAEKLQPDAIADSRFHPDFITPCSRRREGLSPVTSA